jgi:hypothetical protein
LTEVIEGINYVSNESIKAFAENNFEKDTMSLTTLGLSKETKRKVDEIF